MTQPAFGDSNGGNCTERLPRLANWFRYWPGAEPWSNTKNSGTSAGPEFLSVHCVKDRSLLLLHTPARRMRSIVRAGYLRGERHQHRHGLADADKDCWGVAVRTLFC